jgi:hypothetical protein
VSYEEEDTCVSYDQRTALYWWYAAHRTALYSSSSSSVGKFVRQSGATDFRGISKAYQRHIRGIHASMTENLKR